MRLLPFDIEKAKNGTTICTREGTVVEWGAHLPKANENERVVVTHKGYVYFYNENGKSSYSQAGGDLFIRQETITINGVEVPAPLKEAPEEGTMVFIASPSGVIQGFENWFSWSRGSVIANYLLKAGLLHPDACGAYEHMCALVLASGGEWE